MSLKPIILAVDDDPEALSAMRAALSRRYGEDYEVIAERSARVALARLEQEQRDDRAVALMIADQWMDRGFETNMPGVFAVGDVRSGSVKRLASSVGEGSVAVQAVHEYLRES